MTINDLKIVLAHVEYTMDAIRDLHRIMNHDLGNVTCLLDFIKERENVCEELADLDKARQALSNVSCHLQQIMARSIQITREEKISFS